MPLLGCVFVSSLFASRAPAGHCLISVVLGGARSKDLPQMSSETLSSVASNAVRRLLGVHTEPAFARTSVWPQAMPQYELGTAQRSGRIRAELSKAGPLFFAGNAFEGAFLGDSARRGAEVAEAVAARLGKANVSRPPPLRSR